jgi:hypothetical protein
MNELDSNKFIVARELHFSGNIIEALVIYEGLLQRNKKEHELQFLIGIAYLQTDKYNLALDFFKNSINLHTNNPAYYYNTGLALQCLGRLNEALANYFSAIKLEQNYLEAYVNSGVALKELRRFEEALVIINQALKLNAEDYQIHSNRGAVLKELKRFEEALVSLDQALKLNAEDYQIHSNRGVVLKELKRFEEALVSFENAISLNPNHAESFFGKATVYYDLKCYGKALNAYNKAIKIKADYQEAISNRATLHLIKGNYPEGWLDWEKRKFLNPHENVAKKWSGEIVAPGKVILLFAEQGFGDTIQFCRYIEKVEKIGFKVILDVPASLKEILKTLKTKFIFIDENKYSIDYISSILSLPLIFKTNINTIPANIPYLYSDNNKKLIWKKRLESDKNLNIGLVWAGGFRKNQPETWEAYEKKSIPMHLLEPITQISNVNIYSLQKGDPAESELINLNSNDWRFKIRNLTSEIIDFSDTAAFIDNLDLIISVCTSSAHLAAAMGKKTWILLDYYSCWRWFDDGRTDSPWYPSVRLFKQPKPNDWESTIAEVCEELKSFTSSNLS